MEMSEIATMIGSIGFPIVMCLIFVKLFMDTQTKHSEEMSKITDAVNNNTLVMQKLIDEMGGLTSESCK